MGGVVSDDLALVNNPSPITQDVRLLDNVGGEEDSDSLLVPIYSLTLPASSKISNPAIRALPEVCLGRV